MTAEDFLGGGQSAEDFLNLRDAVPGFNDRQSATQTASVEPPASLANSLSLTPDPAIGSEIKRGFLGQPSNAAGTTERIAYEAGRVGLPTTLSMGGQALGGEVGPLAALGAGAGAGLGSALQSGARALARRAGAQDVPEQTLAGAAKDAGAAAATNAAFAAGGGLLAKGAAALKPGAVRAGAQLLRAGPGIPEKYGAAALGDLEKLIAAQTPEDVSAGYKAFEGYTGLKGLGAQIVDRGESWSPKELERLVIGAAKKVAGGQTVDPQELYSASQAASKLKQFAKYGEPQAKSVVEAGIIDQSKGLVEDALAKIYPEYSNLRSDYFWSKAADQFKSPLPLNKNQGPNVLRTWAATAAAGSAAGGMIDGKEGATIGGALGLFAPLAISPAIYGAGLRGAYAGAQVAGPLLPVARAAAATELADAYRRHQLPAR